MDREDAAALLQKAGYHVDNGGSIMMVLVGEEQRKTLSEAFNAIMKTLRSAGYSASFGVKVGEKGSS